MKDGLLPCFGIKLSGEGKLSPRHVIKLQERRQRLGVSHVGTG